METAGPLSVVDFGDWMSPIIVKELRQGMRTWVFSGAFIALQAVLVLTLTISAAAKTDQGSSYFFWSMVAVILVLVMPLRGFNALTEELKLQTLDLLVLTRLSVWRIAFGKWIALVTQSTLIAISTLPYVVLRYFSGGVNLFQELWGLYLLWLLSGVLTALAVGFSSQRSVLLRLSIAVASAWIWIPITFYILQTITSPDGGFYHARSFLGGSSSTFLILAAAFTALWAYLCYFLIDMGSSVIAPAAANHATRKRLVSLALLATAAGAFLVLPDTKTRSILWQTVVLGLLSLSWLDALTENPVFVPSTYRPFAKGGRVGFIAALFLAPGWPTGLLFCAVSVGLYLLIGHQFFGGSTNDFLWVLNVPAGLLFGLAVTLTLFPRQNRLLAPFLTVQFAFALYGVLILMLAGLSEQQDAAWLGLLSPASACLAAMAVPDPKKFSILLASASLGAIAFVYLLVRGSGAFKKIWNALREAAATESVARTPESMAAAS